jgi:hypothetical protein
MIQRRQPGSAARFRMPPALGIAGLLAAFAASPAPYAQSPSEPVAVSIADTPSPSIPVIVFSFERQGLPVPSYLLAIAQDGNGQYAGTEVAEIAPSNANASPAPEPQPFGRAFAITPATAGHIVDLARNLHNFNDTCASTAKNIADTGKKRLTYSGPDGHGSCTYNYTENKSAQALTELFEGIATTMDMGRRLDLLHRFDRLGLDDATAILTDEVSHGRALEIVTIAPSLRAIADDAEVMQRVRARAKALLAQIPASAPNR